MPASRVLIIGAQPGSLGSSIAEMLRSEVDEVVRAGVGRELVRLDVTSPMQVREVLENVQPTHVVCTVGINEGAPFYDPRFIDLAQRAMAVNYEGPMRVLGCFERLLDGMPGTFIAISSNSARIARSSSAAYCASKAALSMGLRVAARDLARAGKPLRVWGYEPGALAGTPMTNEVARRLKGGVPMSRMLTSPQGLPVAAVARVVARDLLGSGELLHGCIVPLDNGDA